jgi:hypothetical protein
VEVRREMKFDSIIQEAVYRKVQQFLYELFARRDDVAEVPRSPSFRVIKGSAVTYIDVTPLGENEASVTVRCALVSGARVNKELLEFLLRENAALRFGAFAIDSRNDVIFSHSIVGSTLNREELGASVHSVMEVSDKYDDKVIAQFGGTTSLSRLQEERQHAAASVTPERAKAERLVAFLKGKGVEVISTGTPREEDAVLDPIASLLGKRYDVLEPLVRSITGGLGRNGTFSVPLADARQEHIGVMTSFATMLHRNALLTRYRYTKAPNRVIYGAVLTTDERVRQFFTGGWLERYARNVAVSHSRRVRQGKPVECVNNLKVRLGSRQEFEFDLLVGFDSSVIWIECKTGRYQEHIAKYRDIGDTLGIPAERRILVLGDRQEEETRRNLSTLYRLVVLSPEDFGTYLEEAMGEMGTGT